MVGCVAIDAPQHFGSVEAFCAIAVQGAVARSPRGVTHKAGALCIQSGGFVALAPKGMSILPIGGRRFVRKNANGPHDMTSIRESMAAGRKMT